MKHIPAKYHIDKVYECCFFPDKLKITIFENIFLIHLLENRSVKVCVYMI